MTKNLYIFLILFLGLTAMSGIANSIFNFQFGPQIFMSDAYSTWFFVVSITFIIGSILLLYYYYCQDLRFAFFTGTVAIITYLGYSTVAFIIVISRELESYYLPVSLVYLCATMLYAGSLIFSNTRKKFWLKSAGVYAFIVSVVLLLTLIELMYVKDVGVTGISVKIAQWASLAGYFVPVLFIMNFLSELRMLNEENVDRKKGKSLEDLVVFTWAAAFLFTATIGTLLTIEVLSSVYWSAENARELVNLAGGTKTFVNSKGASLQYLLIKPLGYDRKKKYPLVVCLPYGGYQAPPAGFLSTGIYRTTYPAFIFVPYCQDVKGWGSIPGSPSLDELVYETISSFTEPGIDVKRRYVTGVSGGGYATWQFICTRPDLFAAAIPVSGGGDPKLAPKIVKIPVWAFHGAKDKNVPVSGSRDMIAAIKKAGGHPRYTEYPNEAHGIWGKVSETPGLWNWLFAQKRE